MSDAVLKSPTTPKRVYRHEPASVDDKGRVMLHKEIKDAVGDQVTLVIRTGGAMRMYPQAEFDRLEDALYSKFSEENEAASYYRQAVISNARRDVKVEPNGRLLIPADVRLQAKIDKKCVVIANGNEFHIMNPSDYDAYCKSPTQFRVTERKEIDELRAEAFAVEKQLQELNSYSKGDN